MNHKNHCSKERQSNRKRDCMRGEIISQNNDVIEVKLFDELDVQSVKKQAINGRYFVTVDVFEKDSITNEQRKHLYALFGDIAEYIGLPLDHVEAERKYQFMLDEGLSELPSLGYNNMKKVMASKFIEHTIMYCIDNDIPFRKENWYLDQATSKMLFALTMKRICWVCGTKGSQLAHYEAVGLGRNRNKIDHTKHHFMCLCHDCHTKQHQMGVERFMKLHHIKPIRLSAEYLKELNIRGKYD